MRTARQIIGPGFAGADEEKHPGVCLRAIRGLREVPVVAVKHGALGIENPARNFFPTAVRFHHTETPVRQFAEPERGPFAEGPR
ncbi:MAG TPA: hypothetical protein VF614_08490 [Chthoniobacteraceae bacterium]|jgi:hypothetical protein